MKPSTPLTIKLINLIDLIDLISKRGQTHIILTGRNAPKKLIELADLVTEMKNVKHPFDSGKRQCWDWTIKYMCKVSDTLQT